MTNQTSDSLKFSPEVEARDRVEMLVHFIRAQLEHATEDFDTAAGSNADTKEGRLAAQNGFCALKIAREYLDELAKLEERPIDRGLRAA